MSMKFDRGYGRVFVEKEEDIEKVKAIMREIDQEEFDYYYPDRREGELVTVFDPKKYETIYTHKFDEMDMAEVMRKAWEQGIKCFVVKGRISGYEDVIR